VRAWVECKMSCDSKLSIGGTLEKGWLVERYVCLEESVLCRLQTALGG
jgi:hypothetical protein